MIWLQYPLLVWLLRRCGLHWSAAFVALVAFVPIHGISLAMALRGLWGDPSVTLLQLLLLALFDRTPVSIRYGWRLPAFTALLALALYLSALGPWDVDLYRLGYRPAYLVAGFGTLALAAWWRGYATFLWLFTIDLLCWRAGLLESVNLWDTLVDPLLMLAMLALALQNGYRARRRQTIIPAGL